MINYEEVSFTIMSMQKIECKIKTLKKFKVNDTYKKDEKMTTNFEASNPEDLNNNGFLYAKLAEVKGHISYREKVYND